MTQASFEITLKAIEQALKDTRYQPGVRIKRAVEFIHVQLGPGQGAGEINGVIPEQIDATETTFGGTVGKEV